MLGDYLGILQNYLGLDLIAIIGIIALVLLVLLLLKRG